MDFSKRCTLAITKDGFEAGNEKIQYNKINSAKMRIYDSAFFVQGCVLSLKGDNFHHHFGLMYTDYWKGEFPIEINRYTEKAPGLWFRRFLFASIIVFTIFSLMK